MNDCGHEQLPQTKQNLELCSPDFGKHLMFLFSASYARKIRVHPWWFYYIGKVLFKCVCIQRKRFILQREEPKEKLL